MQIYGIDFTSAPASGRGKKLPCISGVLEGEMLVINGLDLWDRFEGFENLLATRGPWVMALDFPCTLPRNVVDFLHWPIRWDALAAHIGTLPYDSYHQQLNNFIAQSAVGHKHPRRRCDTILLPAPAGSNSDTIRLRSISPLNLQIRRMPYQGLPRLQKAGVTVAGVHAGASNRIAVEAYPALYPPMIFGKKIPYKDRADTMEIRRQIIDGLLRGGQLDVKIPSGIIDEALSDNHGDILDSIICAVSGAHHWRTQRHLPVATAPLDGYIAFPPVPQI